MRIARLRVKGTCSLWLLLPNARPIELAPNARESRASIWSHAGHRRRGATSGARGLWDMRCLCLVARARALGHQATAERAKDATVVHRCYVRWIEAEHDEPTLTPVQLVSGAQISFCRDIVTQVAEVCSKLLHRALCLLGRALAVATLDTTMTLDTCPFASRLAIHDLHSRVVVLPTNVAYRLDMQTNNERARFVGLQGSKRDRLRDGRDVPIPN